MGQERLGPSYFFIPLVLGPLNSLVWYVPSLRYTRGLGWRMHCGAEVTESSTNKQHHLSALPSGEHARCTPTPPPPATGTQAQRGPVDASQRQRAARQELGVPAFRAYPSGLQTLTETAAVRADDLGTSREPVLGEFRSRCTCMQRSKVCCAQASIH